MDKKMIVVGFPIEFESYKSKEYYDSLNDRQKHEHALYDEEAIIYDNVNDFFNEMNEDLVDTEHNYWYVIQID